MSADAKTLEVLPAAELAEGTMKAVEFDGGKVLLSKINGQVVCAQLLPETETDGVLARYFGALFSCECGREVVGVVRVVGVLLTGAVRRSPGEWVPPHVW
jgi:hypothetical protein